MVSSGGSQIQAGGALYIFDDDPRSVTVTMTIVNTTYGFIFIHIPKTGGTSVKEHLRDYCREGDVHINLRSGAEPSRSVGRFRVRKHSTARVVCKVVGRAEYDRLFKFCVVRNPFIRTLSLFRFLKFNFRSWQRSEVMDELHTLEEFVTTPLFASAGPGGIISPQVHWLTGESGENGMDYIARVERIEQDLSEIKARLGLPPSPKPLLRRNASKGDAENFIAGLMSDKVVDAVRTRYASDFSMLGYSTDPGDAMGLEQATKFGLYAR